MSFIEKLLKAIPYVRRPFYQRDTALAGLAAANAELEWIKRGGVLADQAPRERVFGEEAWFLSPDDDPAQDRAIGDLRSYIANAVAKNAPSLEIGPSINPILPKSGGYSVTIMDHADRDGLIEKYKTHNVDVSGIEPIDIVCDVTSMAQAIGTRKFDAIVASHVIEHAPDFLGFLNDCAGALTSEGAIYLMIPDKRYSFDFLQSLTDVAKILGDHRSGRKQHSFESYYRLTNCVHNGTRGAWSQNEFSNLSFVHGDPIDTRRTAEESLRSQRYTDVHANCFTPVSFAMILEELHFIGEIALRPTVVTRSRGCEFLAVLKASRGRSILSTEQFLERKMQGYAFLAAEELERLTSGEPRYRLSR